MMNIHYLLEAVSSSEEFPARDLLACLMDSQTTDAQLAALSAAWRLRGLRAADLIATEAVLRKRYLPTIALNEDCLDCCGTGGDGSATFNISTVAAMVTACTGLRVAKNGGRKTTSSTGSVDFLEAIGLQTAESQDHICGLLTNVGLAFVSNGILRKNLARWKSICGRLNFFGQTGLLGVLSNPVLITHQVVGVCEPSWLPELTECLYALGRKGAAVVFGRPRLDEFSICGINELHLIRDGKMERQIIVPEDLGINTYELSELGGGTPSYNAKLFESLIEDQSAGQALKLAISANAGLNMYVAGAVDSIREGLNVASSIINDGRLREIVCRYRSVMQALQQDESNNV